MDFKRDKPRRNEENEEKNRITSFFLFLLRAAFFVPFVSSWFISFECYASTRLFVMNIRLRAQFGGFLFRRCVAQEIAAADLRTRQILQQVRTPQRWMKLDVKMEPAMVAPVGRRLVQRHHVRERPP